MLNYTDLHQRAEKQLDFAPYSPRLLVLIHTAVSLGASLLMAIVNVLFASLIENTGGLGGLGTRSILETAQAVLELAVTLALPFWNISLVRAALNWARGEYAAPTTLLEGFRLFRPILRMFILLLAIFVVLGIALSQISAMLFMFTPFADPLMTALEPLMQDAGYFSPDLLLTEEAIAQVGSAIIPYFVFFGVLFALVAIPVWYRIRFADYAVMDEGRARAALLTSLRITKGRCLQVLKIDLRFWWFYLLQALSVALCYGDSILPALGIALPMSAEAAYITFMALGVICQGLLLWYYQAKVSVTYALAYEELKPEN